MEQQFDLSSEETARSTLDQLLDESRLYHTGKDYKGLLDFVVRLPEFGPFNAMLLHIQKPGLMYAASAHDWRVRFGRSINVGARPLIILWPFAPVALVYDVDDTNGQELPSDIDPFTAKGAIDANRPIARFQAPIVTAICITPCVLPIACNQ